MAKQAMFYEQIVPVNRGRHAKWSVLQGGQNFGFCAQANAVPLMTAEFMTAATEFPIVFVSAEEGFSPVAVLGIEHDTSLFVNEDGSWNGHYVPAFIRRYPFITARTPDGSTLALGIDEDYEGCDPTGKTGQRLFTSGGEHTEYFKSALELVATFETEQRRTQEFGKLLKEHDLMEAMQANITTGSGAQRQLREFHVVEREKLKAIDSAVLESFFQRDVLELIYCHLASLANLDKLRRRLTI